ncbi:MAG: hypothetical protein KDK10_14555 [Maritimibacter sp.]|nr:hypothetical protein [Maritimibacter sp.]
MAGLLSYRRAEAEARPLTPETLARVIATSRRVCLTQLALFAALAAGLGWTASRLDGAGSAILGGLAALAAWGVLAAALSTWDHFRASIALGRLTPASLAAETDPRAFWWTYRAVFPMQWTMR